MFMAQITFNSKSKGIWYFINKFYLTVNSTKTKTYEFQPLQNQYCCDIFVMIC